MVQSHKNIHSEIMLTKNCELICFDKKKLFIYPSVHIMGFLGGITVVVVVGVVFFGTKITFTKLIYSIYLLLGIYWVYGSSFF